MQAELARERSASRTWVHAALPGSTGTCPGTGSQGWTLRVAGLDTWGCRLGAHGVAGGAVGSAGTCRSWSKRTSR
eukprot:scaffold14945_cov36-Phaeocystis_antarctica.AAC.2